MNNVFFNLLTLSITVFIAPLSVYFIKMRKRKKFLYQLIYDEIKDTLGQIKDQKESIEGIIFKVKEDSNYQPFLVYDNSLSYVYDELKEIKDHFKIKEYQYINQYYSDQSFIDEMFSSYQKDDFKNLSHERRINGYEYLLETIYDFHLLGQIIIEELSKNKHLKLHMKSDVEEEIKRKRNEQKTMKELVKVQLDFLYVKKQK